MSNYIICILTGIVIVVLSILIMYYNIGLPNSLRGFLFYSQVNLAVTCNHNHAVNKIIASYIHMRMLGLASIAIGLGMS